MNKSASITQADIDQEVDKRLMIDLAIDKDELTKLKNKLNEIEPRSEKGIETLFRLLSQNQYTLNTMIDTKSNILISINALILSLVIGTVLSQLDTDPHLIAPSAMLLITNLTSIYFAVLATRPELTHGARSINNVMFYGNFHQMTETDYIKTMTDIMNQGDKVYETIAKDTFYLGKTINCKFLLLRRSFTIFLFGLIASVIFFILCHILY